MYTNKVEFILALLLIVLFRDKTKSLLPEDTKLTVISLECNLAQGGRLDSIFLFFPVLYFLTTIFIYWFYELLLPTSKFLPRSLFPIVLLRGTFLILLLTFSPQVSMWSPRKTKSRVSLEADFIVFQEIHTSLHLVLQMSLPSWVNKSCLC